MRSYLEAMSRYADYYGTTSRRDFWTYLLVLLLLLISATLLDLGLKTPSLGIMGGLVTAFVTVVHLVPTLSIQVRRLQDAGRSGLWALIGLIPVVGLMVLLLLALEPSIEEEDGDEDTFTPNTHTDRSTELGAIDRLLLDGLVTDVEAHRLRAAVLRRARMGEQT